MTPAVVFGIFVGLVWAVLLVLIGWTFGQSAADREHRRQDRNSRMPCCAPSARISTQSSGSSSASLISSTADLVPSQKGSQNTASKPLRAVGPLDAIIQVAGRVDREGRLTAEAGRPAGRLIVFRTEDGKTPPHSYKAATGIAEAIARTHDVQPDDLTAMELFFERYYTENDLGSNMMELRKRLQFEDLADSFEMISSRTESIFVPYGEGAELIERVRASGFLDITLLRLLQQYSVGLQPWEFEQARQQVLYEVVPGRDLWTCSPAAYDEEKGLLFEQTPDRMVV